MNEVDAIIATEFSWLKAVAFGSCFVLAALLQLLAPHQNTVAKNLRNWRVNFSIGAINSVLFAVFCGNCVCALAARTKAGGNGLLDLLAIPYLWQMVFSVLVLDLIAYLFHRFYHRIHLFWRLHGVHHSDQVFEASTAVRFHPGEILISLGVRLFFVWALGIPVIGLLVFEGLYILFNLVEHADFNLPPTIDHVLSVLFITPSLHRLHHSVLPDELQSNFGTIFSIWDRLFGTFRAAKPGVKVEVGIRQYGQDNLSAALMLPFKTLGNG